MSRDRSDLAAAVRRYAAERRAAAGPHPGLEEIVAYDRGELGEIRRDELREHLASCPECARWLLDYREFDRAEPAGSEADAETAAAWQRERGTAWDEIQRSIGALEEASPAEAAADGAEGAVRPLRPHRPQGAPSGYSAAQLWTTGLLAAACVILAVLLWQARAEVEKPEPATIVSLAPAGSGILRGGTSPGRTVVRPPRGHRLVLTLAFVGIGEQELFAAEIFPPTGEGPSRVVEVERRSDDALAIDLGADPPPGSYRIVLHDLSGPEPREVASYDFRIGLPEPDR